MALEFTKSVIFPISSGALTLMRLLDGSTQLGEALPKLIDRQLVQRSQTTVGQVVDVIDVRRTRLEHATSTCT